jgi:hypothetical protein
MEGLMKLLATLSVLTLAVLPSLALADCRGDKLDQTAASCMPGMVWDPATGTCVEAPAS